MLFKIKSGSEGSYTGSISLPGPNIWSRRTLSGSERRQVLRTTDPRIGSGFPIIADQTSSACLRSGGFLILLQVLQCE
ncbi:hypothetical protein FLAG1_06792 [Fusarium langsethiae]|uniref:Uncharacterized protein n=1 Tax=Fusarium langsethiae TaxID=179993 RepID=A0A0N1J2N2_FUSLA|nr:hypothetical protein FLAG1_06792 [Fusarium langsethiae]